MQHARMYLQLAEGSGEPGPDQHSKPRRAIALLCLLLVVAAVPAFSVTAAFADSGPGSDGTAVREDSSGPGSGGDDDDDDDDTTRDPATTDTGTDGPSLTDGDSVSQTATGDTGASATDDTGASDDTGATGNEGSPVAVAAQNRAAARCANAKQAARRAAKASTRKQKLRKARASAACRRAAR